MTNNSRALEIGVKAFLYQKPKKFLFLKRANPYQNNSIRKWDIPGGRIIPGELLLKALKREVGEETGLKIKRVEKILAAQDILRVTDKHTVRITFLASCLDGKVKIDPNEHCEYKWLTLNEIKKLRKDIYLKPVIKDLLNF
jgi:ADP-ribose pyrophosphatase YjhB (NUDIX family)